MNEVNFQTEIQSKLNFGHHRLTAHFYERSGIIPIRFILINIWCYFLSKCSTLYHEFFSKKKNFLVRSGIRTHALIRGPECSLLRSEEYSSWVLRLRPLGHPDMLYQWVANLIFDNNINTSSRQIFMIFARKCLS